MLALGQLTNLAFAWQADARLPGLLREIVWMGSSSDRGNHTAAKFNAFVDPEAAEQVLTSGVPFVFWRALRDGGPEPDPAGGRDFGPPADPALMAW